MNRRSFFEAIFGAAVLPKVADVVTNLVPAAEIAPAFTPAPIIRTFVPIQINWQSGHDFEFTDTELQLDMDRFSDRYLRPALQRAERLQRERMDREIAWLSEDEWT